MGAWGTKIYQNDISSEVKDDYKNKLKAGKSDEEALNEILYEYDDCIGDSDDRYDFWFALADTMWTLGRPTNQVKERTLELIDMEDEEGRWETEKERKARLKVLEDLKQKLLSEMPPRKKIPIYKPFTTPWKPGEVYVYQVKNPPIDEAYNPPKDYRHYIGWYITLYVHEIVEKHLNLPGVPDRIPCIYVMFSKEKPTSVDKLSELQFLFQPYFTREGKRLKNYRWLLSETSLRKYPKDIEYLGICNDFIYPIDEYIEPVNVNFVFWSTIEKKAIRSYEDGLERLHEES